jgi:hypothetical protein
MKKIFVRSPYFITIDEVDQTSGKIELYIWNKGETKPSSPTYTLAKNVPSLNQTKLEWNVSNYAKEFIKPIFPNSVSVPTEENADTWCYMQVISYSNDIEVDDQTFVCLNGYTSYLGGYNQYNTNVVIPLVNNAINFQKTASFVPYVNVFYQQGEYEIIGYGTITIDEDTMYKLPLTADLNGDDYFEYYSTEVCESKYTPVVCSFVNRYGGWQFLTFFKASKEGIETDSKEFNLLPSSTNYNVFQGQRRRFNQQGKQSIKCNTGWVSEDYFELIQDLLLSEVVLLDNVPVNVKTKSSEKKTHLNNRLINYEIDFEYNFGLINDVI